MLCKYFPQKQFGVKIGKYKAFGNKQSYFGLLLFTKLFIFTIHVEIIEELTIKETTEVTSDA